MVAGGRSVLVCASPAIGLLPLIAPGFLSLSLILWFLSSTHCEGVSVGGSRSPFRPLRLAHVSEMDTDNVPVERAGPGWSCEYDSQPQDERLHQKSENG